MFGCRVNNGSKHYKCIAYVILVCGDSSWYRVGFATKHKKGSVAKGHDIWRQFGHFYQKIVPKIGFELT